MSEARPIYKDVSMMLTRGVHGRVFLLKPSDEVNQLIRYVTAVMAKKWSIQLHSIVVMSNHWHLCITDRLRNVVDFQRDCHSFISRALNARHGESDSIWSSHKPSRVETVTPNDLVDEIAYTMANPVEAGGVHHGKEWPGVRHSWPCKPIVVEKPSYFFRGIEVGGKWPRTAELVFARPPGFESISDLELEVEVAEAIEAKEKSCRSLNLGRGLCYLGRTAVLAQSRHRRAVRKRERCKMSPKIACKDRAKLLDKISDNRFWLVEYKSALKRWRAGEKEVHFPRGTYLMRVLYGVKCKAGAGRNINVLR